MTDLVVFGSIIGYLAIGALYARAQAANIYERHTAAWSGGVERPILAGAFLLHILFWPVVMPGTALAPFVGGWFLRPVTDRKERAAQLRADARAWDEKRLTGTPAEREMAQELAKMCRERAREIDL